MLIWINFADSVHNNVTWKKTKENMASYFGPRKITFKNKQNPFNNMTQMT